MQADAQQQRDAWRADAERHRADADAARTAAAAANERLQTAVAAGNVDELKARLREAERERGALQVRCWRVQCEA